MLIARETEVRVTARFVRRGWPVLLALGAASVVVGFALRPHGRTEGPARVAYKVPTRSHLDHTPYFAQPITSPQDVTKACLRCHPKVAEEFMRTAHWQWLGREVSVPGHDGTTRIGKRNLLNNFCINITGNWAACTKCHTGYGWSDASFDFSMQENIDCLVCHERTGTYVKGSAGVPAAGTDLASAARSVGFPRRENCSVCHSYGGGGQGVKHGDLDGSLENPSDEDDVHMGRYGFLCIDCHRAKEHEIPGRAFSVSVEDANGVHCEDCHRGAPHADPRLNRHLASLACQTCHIPTYARKLPTKTEWDWSKAGDSNRPEDPHHYLKIKGEFVYGRDLVPAYQWFNLTADRYLLGDRIDPTAEVDINRPRGDIHDTAARIWPFKVHRALQPYDRQNDILLPPVTGGDGGYWKTFDWDSALRLGAQANGVAYSGAYGFTRTRMYWPLSHAVTPKEEALHCDDCHGAGSRMDWAALGYTGDPIETGGRK